MKQILSISFLLLLFNCNDTKESSSPGQLSPLNRSVGKKISREQADRWINRYTKNHYSSKIETVPQVTETTFRELLDPLNEKSGASFYRALDENGKYHILIAAVQEGRSTWDNTVIDANRNTFISPEIAAEWAARYKEENPNGVWSHFFGAEVFHAAFTRMDLVEAEDDQNSPQLLLFIWRGEAESNGRHQSETPDIYDASAPCPPTCNGSDI